MPESCTNVPERSRENTTAILRALANTSQRHIADVIGVHESTVSKMVTDGSIEKTAHFLAAAGLRLVPASARMYDPEYIKSLQTLAARCLSLEADK